MARFIRTRSGTNWPNPTTQPDRWVAALSRIATFLRIPQANPTFDPQMHLIDTWLIEFPDEDPERLWRELGIDSSGVVIVAGPTETDYGFWHDTDITFDEFRDAEIVDESHFEQLWTGYFMDNPSVKPLD